MNFELRPMAQEDGSHVLEIFRQGIESGNATFEKDIPTWEAWDMNHFKTGRFVLLNEQDEILGWCALKPVSKRECYSGVAEVSIYISNENQNKGFGAILLKKLILDSEEHEFWTLQAGVFPENRASVSLFQKFGFRIVGTREKMAKLNEVWRDVLLMEKRSRIAGTK